MRNYINRLILLPFVAVLFCACGKTNREILSAWYLFSEWPNEKSHFIDHSTIKRNGAIATSWHLMDYKKPQKFSEFSSIVLSSKSQMEFDCETERFRVLSTSGHSGNMGNGNVVGNITTPTEWNSVPPGSEIRNVWRFVCNFK